MARHNGDRAAAAPALPLRKRWKLAQLASAAILAVVMVGGFAAPARSEVDVHLGFGVPYYYPYDAPRVYYDYPRPYYYSYYDTYPRYSYEYRRVWVPGHWARRHHRSNYVRVWIPGYYR